MRLIASAEAGSAAARDPELTRLFWEVASLLAPPSALLCPSARERNLFRPTYVQRLLETPNAVRSTLGSNMTWQLGLLEMWLQRHGVGG